MVFIQDGPIIDDPIADIIDPVTLQDIGGIDGLAQPGRQPAARTPSGKARDLVQTGADDGLFTALDMIDGFLMHAVADELPAGIAHRDGGLRIGIDHPGIEAGRRRQTARRKGAQNARQSRAHSVIGPGEIRHVRNGFAPVRRRHDRARHRLVELPVLDVDDQMNKDAFSVQRRQSRTI